MATAPAGGSPLEELVVDDAKVVLAALVEHINRELGPKVAALLGDKGGAW